MGLCDAAVCCDNWIQFALHVVQIFNFAIGKSPQLTITEPSPCFMVGMILGVAALSSTLQLTQTFPFD